MKLHNAFLIGVLTISGLSSCLSEEFDNELAKKGMGQLEVNVDVLEPAARATTEVKNYPVEVQDVNGATISSYNTVAEMPASIMLQVGNYVVKSHTPGTIEKKMAAPYYRGSQNVEILKGVTSPVNVICKMANSQIRVTYSDLFRELFTSWDITVTDGSETALDFNNASTTNSVFWWFGEDGAKELTVNFRGTTKDGNVIASRSILTKDDADESYNEDCPNFCGGDLVNIDFDTTDATDGTLSSVTITANVVFTETNETINVNVFDTPSFEPENPDPGTDPETNSIKLTLPKPISIPAAESATADPSTGDVVIETENGIKSILVTVKSSSDEMMEQLGAVAGEYPGVDLVNGCEVVGNQNLANFLGSLGKTLAIPSSGDKKYTFPVGQFYLFLGLLPGEHNFTLTVVDMKGEKNSGTVKVTITE